MAIVLALLGLGGLAALAMAATQQPSRGRPAPPDPEVIRQWLATNPLPSEIDAVAAQMRDAGYPETGATLAQLAQQARERPMTPGEPLPPPPPAGTPPPTTQGPSLPLDQGGGAGPAAPSPLTADERAQLDALPAAVAAELTAYLTSRASAADSRAAIFASIARVRAQGSTQSPSEREASASALASMGLPELAAWLRSAPAATPGGAAPPAPPAATPATSAAPPTSSAPPGQGVRTAAYNAAGARQLAPRVASDVRAKGRSYNREQMKEFQRSAGIVDDGVYGGETRGALVFYGVRDAPGPVFRPNQTIAYRPPA
jgi:hypothetical protein